MKKGAARGTLFMSLNNCGEGACSRWVAQQPLILSDALRWQIHLGLLRNPAGASSLATEAPK